MTKRNDYISWNEYFMALAVLSSYRSKDPSTQVGACIVNPYSHRVLSLGYNGFPNGCNDDEYPWDDDKDNILNGCTSSLSIFTIFEDIYEDVKPHLGGWTTSLVLDELKRG